MLREAKSGGSLLYASSDGKDVQVFSYPKGKLKGTLSGFYAAYRECVNITGDVFIVDSGGYAGSPAPKVVGYAHGATTPIETLYPSHYYPQGCSVDPTTGNLAVSGYGSNGQGVVAIYSGAQGTPMLYFSPTDTLLCTYDGSGDLFVDGRGSSGGTISELLKGGSSFTNIAIDWNNASPGSIQWDGHDLAISAPRGAGRGTYGPMTIYRVQISGSTGSIVGMIDLKSGKNIDRNPGIEVQYWIYGNTIIGPHGHDKNIGVWSYPGGGYPHSVIKSSPYPVGVTLSGSIAGLGAFSSATSRYDAPAHQGTAIRTCWPRRGRSARVNK
jgi:hypothetical protein